MPGVDKPLEPFVRPIDPQGFQADILTIFLG